MLEIRWKWSFVIDIYEFGVKKILIEMEIRFVSENLSSAIQLTKLQIWSFLE